MLREYVADADPLPRRDAIIHCCTTESTRFDASNTSFTRKLFRAHPDIACLRPDTQDIDFRSNTTRSDVLIPAVGREAPTGRPDGGGSEWRNRLSLAAQTGFFVCVVHERGEVAAFGIHPRTLGSAL